MPLGALLGARHHETPLRPVRQRRPHLLAVDHPLVAVEHGGGGHVGQVAAGSGLGIALTPQLGDVEDAGQEPLLLLRGSEGDQRRAEQFLAEVVDLGGCVGDRVLLVERNPMRDGQAAAAVLDRPAQTGQAGLREMLIPGEPLVERLVFAAGPAEPFERGEFTDQVLGQPIADLGPELLDALHPCRLTYQALALLAPAAMCVVQRQGRRSSTEEFDVEPSADHSCGVGPHRGRTPRPRRAGHAGSDASPSPNCATRSARLRRR